MLTLPRPSSGSGSRRRHSAFTLIEPIVVVIIIIAVLAAIAGVAYDQFVGDARDTTVHANAEQIDIAPTAASARTDRDPADLVVAAVTDAVPGSGSALLTYLAVSAGDNLTARPRPATGVPSTVEVTDGAPVRVPGSRRRAGCRRNRHQRYLRRSQRQQPGPDAWPDA